MKTFGFTIKLGGFIIEADDLEEAEKEAIAQFKEITNEEIEQMLELRYVQNEDGEFEYVCKEIEEQMNDSEVIQ